MSYDLQHEIVVLSFGCTLESQEVFKGLMALEGKVLCVLTRYRS